MTAAEPELAARPIAPHASVATAGPLDIHAEFPEAASASPGVSLASLHTAESVRSALLPRDVSAPSLAAGIVLGVLAALLVLPMCRRLWLAIRPREIVRPKRSGVV